MMHECAIQILNVSNILYMGTNKGVFVPYPSKGLLLSRIKRRSNSESRLQRQARVHGGAQTYSMTAPNTTAQKECGFIVWRIVEQEAPKHRKGASKNAQPENTSSASLTTTTFWERRCAAPNPNKSRLSWQHYSSMWTCARCPASSEESSLATGMAKGLSSASNSDFMCILTCWVVPPSISTQTDGYNAKEINDKFAKRNKEYLDYLIDTCSSSNQSKPQNNTEDKNVSGEEVKHE